MDAHALRYITLMVFAFAVPAGPEAPSQVRHRMRDGLRAILDEQKAGDLELLLSEVVTNAVRYGASAGGAEISVRVQVEGAVISALIADAGSGFTPNDPPRPRIQRNPGGFGLYLLDRLSTRWGVERNEEGFRVWFRLAR